MVNAYNLSVTWFGNFDIYWISMLKSFKKLNGKKCDR